MILTWTNGGNNTACTGSGQELKVDFWWTYFWIYLINNTEEWNGSSWTEVNDLNTGRGLTIWFGTQILFHLAFGGNSASATSVVESMGLVGQKQQMLICSRNDGGSGTATNKRVIFGGHDGSVLVKLNYMMVQLDRNNDICLSHSKR